MFAQLKQSKSLVSSHFSRLISVSASHNAAECCKVLVVGGGSGGCTLAAKFARKLRKDDVYVIEPSEMHYYQPMFTLVGAGMKTLEASRRLTADVLPKKAKWIKEQAVEFSPEKNTVTTQSGKEIQYEYLIIAVGIKLDYWKIPGLEEALSTTKEVCSNYSPKYVNKTYAALKNFESGNAIFTLPNTPIKCAGAPQKICYISEQYFRKRGIRNQARVIYNTSLPVIFGVKKYADALWKVANKRDIEVNLRTNLVKVDGEEKTAVFQNLDDPSIETTINYKMLHVTPPMSPQEVISRNKEISDAAGYVNVDKFTMQHVKYDNIFALGDCSNAPTSKTAAAVAAQSKVVYHNLCSVMKVSPMKYAYDGYTSCPLVTGYSKCIMAEFDYNQQPLETFYRQDREKYSMFLMKKYALPPVYWHGMLKGFWSGPAPIRRLFHPFGK